MGVVDAGVIMVPLVDEAVVMVLDMVSGNKNGTSGRSLPCCW